MKTFSTLLKNIHTDLMLWYNFGPDRDKFWDLYEDGTYKYQVKPGEVNETDTDLIFEECTFCDAKDEDEIRWRELYGHEGKLYWVYRISTNIYRDKSIFFSQLCCWDFTGAVSDLLTYSNGPSTTLLAQGSTSENGRESLLPLFDRDGVYIAQYRFKSESHAFILLKEGDVVTAINYYKGLYIVQLSYHETVGVLWLAEQNRQDNRPLLERLFGVRSSVLIGDDYAIVSLESCEYWQHGTDLSHYKHYLRDVVAPLFAGREEQRVLLRLSR